MRRIGLIGGMSWESTSVYYTLLNEKVRDALGGFASADILLRSVNFADIVALQTAGKWEEAAEQLARIAAELEAAGAQCLLICTNTMHKVADAVEARLSIPLLHIVDETARVLNTSGMRRPLLLATRYTMEQDFYLGRMRERHGLLPIVPDEPDRAIVHDIIFRELCQGIVTEASREAYRAIIARGAAAGADCVILGCTEVGLLIGPEDSDLPVFDSTAIHTDAAIAFALGEGAPAGEAI